ncbi:hypothetical protein LPP1_g14 [Leptolyngbya phage LPP-1]|uniref:Uncharacterized protein n=1 Tax=Leptolyngbya phage LPP-1 TaxID=2996049 RepID=A0AAE9PXA6_9CAUD|nr:hypothetical protein LPP1_g14 [Leptolyngbya phage LPP-1]
MPLKDYSDDELRHELDARYYRKHTAQLRIDHHNDASPLIISYAHNQESLTIEVGMVVYAMTDDELRRLSVMVGTARHNGKEKANG